MDEVRFVVRDWEQSVSWVCEAADAERAVAALAADPETIEELRVALERYQKPPIDARWREAVPRVDDRPREAGLVVLDLAARLVVADSTFFTPDRSGDVPYFDGQRETRYGIEFHLHPDWLLTEDRQGWRQVAEKRRQERRDRPTNNVRAVLYGRPLLEYIASECWEAHSRLGVVRPEEASIPPPLPVQSSRERLLPKGDWNGSRPTTGISDSEPQALDSGGRDWNGSRPVTGISEQDYETIKNIHAKWLMTRRDDLGGELPRNLFLADRERLSRDMQSRCDQWARQQECPRGLEETSHAYRFGGFGTHEIVMYYELVRSLLYCCWRGLVSQPPSSRGGGLNGFLATEIGRLEQYRDAWLDTPDPDCHLRTPLSVINRERARLPEAVFGRDAMVDPDCPCCQMLADMPGPVFWHLDGSSHDWEFAFDFYWETPEEWEAEQYSYMSGFGTESTDPNSGGLADESPGADAEYVGGMGTAGRTPAVPAPNLPGTSREGAQNGEKQPIWSRCYMSAGLEEWPVGVRLLALSWHVAELILDLNDYAGTKPLVDQVNRDFRNLRDVVSGEPDSRAESLVGPVLEKLDQTLHAVAASFPELEAKCCDLAMKLDTLREPPSTELMRRSPGSDQSP